MVDLFEMRGVASALYAVFLFSLGGLVTLRVHKAYEIVAERSDSKEPVQADGAQEGASDATAIAW